MRSIIVLAFVFTFSNLCAEPTPLEIDSSVKKKTSDKNIRLVHEEIPTDTSDLQQIRYRILQAMLTTRGRIWTYEGEGDGFVLARFDYRGNATLMRIEYNENLVQLKYQDAINDFECSEYLYDGVCYKNKRGYYNYTKNLRVSLALQFNAVEE